MTVEIPNDQITKLQISLRKQANLSSYDPYDPSLPTLPSSLHSTVAAADSPRRLCHRCNSPLLRHPNSLLCIFCGKRPTESPPQPVKFSSTSGYRWFLHSLNLNGSEIVGDSLDGNEKNKERREEFDLSDVLGLKMKWNDAETVELEEIESGPLNLAGFDLDDDFLAERKQESVSSPSEGTLVAIKKRTEFSGSNVSGWQVDFQSAESGFDHGAISSGLFDPFTSSSKDMKSSSTSGHQAQDVAQGSSDQTSEKGGNSFSGLRAGSESTIF